MMMLLLIASWSIVAHADSNEVKGSRDINKDLASMLLPSAVFLPRRLNVIEDASNNIGKHFNLEFNEIDDAINNIGSNIKMIDNSFSTSLNTVNLNDINRLGVDIGNRRKHALELESADPSFTCQSLPTTYDPTMFCSGVVDYSFFLAKGLTMENLESYVRQESQRAVPLFSTQCKSDIKRVICAKYYLPCLENVVADDYSTYQWIGSIPIPFKRPCQSLCAATTYFGNADSCHGLLEFSGANFDCTGNALGLPFAEFDSSNDPLVCNSLPNTQDKVVVASPVELYIGDACAGISEEYYVQPPTDPKFAPLLPPFVAQSISEINIAATIGVYPRFLKSECLLALRKVFCATFIMKSFESNLLDSYFGPTYYPSFPANSLCQDYNEHCFIPPIISKPPPAPGQKNRLPALNCSAIIAGTTLQLYPSGNQVTKFLIIIN